MNNPDASPPRDERKGAVSESKMDLSFRDQALQIINMSLEEAKTQHPLDVPGIFHSERPTLGDTVPVSLYRAVRLLSFRELLGSRLSSSMLYLAGQNVAEKLEVDGINESIQALGDLSIARAAIETHSDNHVVFTATECATCAGMPSIGEAICSFEAGLIAGGLKNSFDGNRVNVVETNCWGLGDRVCRWEARSAPSGNFATSGAFEPTDLIAALAVKAALALDGAVATREINQQLRQAYKQLRESERMAKDLTNMVVHDLRTPLSGIITAMQFIDDKARARLDVTEQETLSIALASSETLQQMIDDLLDVSRLEERRMPLRRRQASLREIADQARSQLAMSVRRKKIGLAFSVPASLPEIDVDPKVIVRVFVNLLGNAVRHTPPEGKIRVKAAVTAGEVAVRISDTGEGIPPEFLERIFEKFAQVEPHKTRRSYSTGLGLTFCKLAVEAHGGRIWAESELGNGSTFTFTLPVG